MADTSPANPSTMPPQYWTVDETNSWHLTPLPQSSIATFECLTCLAIGHEWRMCENNCVRDGRYHMGNPCPWALANGRIFEHFPGLSGEQVRDVIEQLGVIHLDLIRNSEFAKRVDRLRWWLRVDGCTDRFAGRTGEEVDQVLFAEDSFQVAGGLDVMADQDRDSENRSCLTSAVISTGEFSGNHILDRTLEGPRRLFSDEDSMLEEPDDEVSTPALAPDTRNVFPSTTTTATSLPIDSAFQGTVDRACGNTTQPSSSRVEQTDPAAGTDETDT